MITCQKLANAGIKFVLLKCLHQLTGLVKESLLLNRKTLVQFRQVKPKVSIYSKYFLLDIKRAGVEFESGEVNMWQLDSKIESAFAVS